MTLRWNRDKPHRCPQCHAIWVYGDKYAPNDRWEREDPLVPRWWKTYDCYRCGAVFTGRRGPWLWQFKILSKINYIRRGLKWRFDR